MNCEKCGHEMLMVKLSAFYTHYACPVCGHEIHYAPLDDTPDDDTFDYMADEINEMGKDTDESDQ